MIAGHNGFFFKRKKIITFICLMMLVIPVMVAGKTPGEDSESTISMNFKDYPLNAIVHLVAEMTPQEETMLNLGLLDGIKVTVKVKHVNAFELLDRLLKEKGLKVHRTSHTWEYSKL